MKKRSFLASLLGLPVAAKASPGPILAERFPSGIVIGPEAIPKKEYLLGLQRQPDWMKDIYVRPWSYHETGESQRDCSDCFVHLYDIKPP